MKKLSVLTGFLLFLGLIGTSLQAEQSSSLCPLEKLGDSLPPFLSDGQLLLNARARYEYADDTRFNESNALTLRTRLGFQTVDYNGLSGLIEAEDTRIIGPSDNFDSFPSSSHTLIADPKNTVELNRAHLNYANWETQLNAGRQRITLDNARFVGNVGWRQNEQTFDAVSIASEQLEDFSLFYSYIGQVNRIFGNDAPSASLERFHSDIHLINLSYSGISFGNLTSYLYLLDLDDSPDNASDTFGLSFSGTYPLSDSLNMEYRAEWARQKGAYDNPTSYQADYLHLKVGGSYKKINAGLAYELLENDGNGSFRTPLATGHKFNGWADLFLTTPTGGLQDIYAWVGFTLPYESKLTLLYHNFQDDGSGLDYGDEVDGRLSRAFGEHWAAQVKFAYFNGRDDYHDVQRFWLQLEYTL